MLCAHVWNGNEGKVNVAVPVPDNPIWRKWLRGIDPSSKEYHRDSGYWSLTLTGIQRSSLPKRLKLCGWRVSKGNPFEDVPRQPPPMTDPYATLHLLPSAPYSVVKAVYKALMLMYHPDTSTSEEAQQKAQQINEAKSIIDAHRRGV